MGNIDHYEMMLKSLAIIIELSDKLRKIMFIRSYLKMEMDKSHWKVLQYFWNINVNVDVPNDFVHETLQ